jgi:cation diffusion facilitator family transporter
MAVLADGWHMSTHALALAAGYFAYRFARTHKDHPAFSFGTGKVHALGGYTSAIFLAVVAAVVFGESFWRLLYPEPIRYNEALLVAALGFMVNMISVRLLHIDSHHHHELHHDHEHDHDHSHHHHAHEHHHDSNLKAAYAHVALDAMTSVLAIVGLLVAKYSGWVHIDPIIGIIGAGVIAQWAWQLIRNTAFVLIDRQANTDIASDIRKRIESDGDSQVADLHVWPVAPGRTAAIISVVAHDPHPIDYYKEKLHDMPLDHLTIEVNRCTAH